MGRAEDIALLRRFEPVLRYTRGERFFPMSAEAYVRESSLWIQRSGSAARCLVPEGQLTREKLAEHRAEGFDAVTYLQFIEPLNLADLARYQLQASGRRKERDELDGSEAARGRLPRGGDG